MKVKELIEALSEFHPELEIDICPCDKFDEGVYDDFRQILEVSSYRKYVKTDKGLLWPQDRAVIICLQMGT